MRGVIIGVAAVLAALTIWLASNLIPASGVFVKLEPKLVSRCEPVSVAPGTEDVTIDPELNAAFISAAERRGWYNDTGELGAAPTNGIYLMSLDGRRTLRRVSPDMEDFLPHGISLWRGANGEKRLFVVNHPTRGGEFVEIFDVAPTGDLTHLESIAFDAMHSPNDVLAVGARQFYATNDRRYESGPLSMLEAYYALPLSSVVYFDGATGRIAAKGLSYANGINQSLDGAKVYVAEILRRRISVYDRDPETGALTRTRRIKVKTAPDNIEVARDGALWVAGHTKIFDFLAHARDPEATAPSHVIRVNPRTGENKELFVDTTGAINASSVGAVWDQTLIVGAVFDDHVMVCPMLEIFLRPPETQ